MTNDELIARAEANVATHERMGEGDLQRVKDMKALIAALKASEARVAELEANLEQAIKKGMLIAMRTPLEEVQDEFEAALAALKGDKT